MSKNHLTRIFSIIKAEGQKPEVHEQVLEHIVASQATIRERARALLSLFDKDPYKKDAYWEPVFESMVLATYGQADVTLSCFAEELRSDEYDAGWKAYPAVIVGAMCAVQWVDKYWSGAPGFAERFPALLANLVGDYNTYTVGINQDDQPGWMSGKFTRAFKDFFEQDAEGPRLGSPALRSLQSFCSQLEIRIENLYTDALMRPLEQLLQEMLPRPARIEALCAVWKNAKFAA